MIQQMLFISLTIILVMLAVMTIITYYFHEKSRFRREYVHDMIKAMALALSEIGKEAENE